MWVLPTAILLPPVYAALVAIPIVQRCIFSCTVESRTGGYSPRPASV